MKYEDEECKDMDLACDRIRSKECRYRRRQNVIKKKKHNVEIFQHRNSDGNNNTVPCQLRAFAVRECGDGEYLYLVKQRGKSINTTTMKKRSSRRIRRMCSAELPLKGNYYKKIGDRWGWYYY